MNLLDTLAENFEKSQDIKFMKAAYKEAEKADKDGDVPIGCVIVQNGRVIARGHNRRNKDKSVLSHAEITAIRKACKKTGDWRLEDVELYVTLEPCPMCAGALGWSQISRIVYGAADEKRGYRAFAPRVLHPKTEVTAGILETECKETMQSFFKNKRQ